MLSDVFRKRFQELQDKSDSLPVSTTSYGTHYVPTANWTGWATSCQSLIRAVYGEHSPHYVNFSDSLKHCSGSVDSVEALQAIFDSSKEDFEGGYVFNVDLRISGEVFGDFVVLAKESLASGHKDVAAVLATAALEDSLKRYATASGLKTDGQTMTGVINALKSKGLVSGATKSLLDSMPRIRNAALHADWEKISEPDVSSVVGFVEQFLLKNFGHN